LFGQGAQALLDVGDKGTVILSNVDNTHPTTQHHIPQDHALQLRYCENLKSYVIQIDIKLKSYVNSSSEMPHCSCCSEMVTIDRYCHDRFIDLLPVLDVDSHVSYEDLTDMWPTFQEILAIFPNLRCGDGHNLTKYGRVFLYGTLFWVKCAWCVIYRRLLGVSWSLIALLWRMCAQAVCLQHGVQEEWGQNMGKWRAQTFLQYCCLSPQELCLCS